MAMKSDMGKFDDYKSCWINNKHPSSHIISMNFINDPKHKTIWCCKKCGKEWIE